MDERLCNMTSGLAAGNMDYVNCDEVIDVVAKSIEKYGQFDSLKCHNEEVCSK